LQRRGAELGTVGRGEERSLAEARSGAWQGRRVKLGRGEERTGTLEVLYGMCLIGSFIFLLFLWLAVLAASGCVVTMVRQRETGGTTVTGGGGSVEESG
jgi:predicted phage tail protein